MSEEIANLAQQMSKLFTTFTRKGETEEQWCLRPEVSKAWSDYYVLTQQDSPATLDVQFANSMMEVLNADDWRYEFVVQSLDALIDNDGEYEAAYDSLEADILTHKLTGWLNSRVDRYAYCDEVKEEYGQWLGDSLIDILRCGQLYEKREVFWVVYRALSELVTEEDE